MRAQTIAEEMLNVRTSREVRIVVRIMYDVASISITSRRGIANVPGVNLSGVLQKVSSTTQKISPEEGRATIGGLSFEVVDGTVVQALVSGTALGFTSDFDTIGDAFGDFLNNGVQAGDTARDDATGVHYLISFVTANRVDMVGDPNPVEWDARDYTVFAAGIFNLTGELREQLDNNNAGVRGNEVRVFMGWDDDFDNFERVATYFVDKVIYSDGKYRITCRDRSQALRKSVFRRIETFLAPGVLFPESTTIVCTEDLTVKGFQTIETHAGFKDGASGTYGWARIPQTGEVFRYDSISGQNFLGCVRGRFFTNVEEIEIEAGEEERIEEFIYMEGPSLWTGLAVMTGVIDPGASPVTMLPDHWHLGLDYDNDIDIAAWEDIGTDLYDPTDMTVGYAARVTYQGETDGKKWLEQEIYQMTGVYSPALADGKLSLRRVNQMIASAPYVVQLGRDEIVKANLLTHDQQKVINNFVINWNYDGEEFTSQFQIIDTQSVGRHGPAGRKVFDFKLLHTASHTEGVIRARMAVLQDRYANPPILMNVDVTPDMNVLEVGDIVFVTLDSLQDYQDDGVVGHLNRSFEIQSTRIDWQTGRVSLTLFASSRTVSNTPGNQIPVAPLDASYYTNKGTSIASLGEYAGSRLTNYNFVGHDNLNNSNAYYFHVGNLTIDGGFLNKNVAILVDGFLTIDNATLDGKGRGHAGAVHTDSVGSASSGWRVLGTKGYIGPTFGGSSVNPIDVFTGTIFVAWPSPPPRLAGTQQAVGGPALLNLLITDSGFIAHGIPSELRGTSGCAGAQCSELPISLFTALPQLPDGTEGTVRAMGGDGGASGAGLLIVCKGLAFTAGGAIDVSGDDGLPGDESDVVSTPGDWEFFQIGPFGEGGGGPLADYPVVAGSGGGGAPGAIHVLLDGGAVPYPSISNEKIIANYGATPENVDAKIGDLWDVKGHGSFASYMVQGQWPELPRAHNGDDLLAGRDFVNLTNGKAMWDTAFKAQYIPDAGDPAQKVLRPPNRLTATTDRIGGVLLTLQQPFELDVETEIFRSADNDRANAVEIGQGNGWEFWDAESAGGTFYYWVRNKNVVSPETSVFFPESATAGVVGTGFPSISHLTAEELLATGWRYTFEDPVWDNNPPDIASSQFAVKDADSHSDAQAALLTAGGGVTTRTITLQIPESLAISWVGRRLRFSWWYKQPASNPSNDVRMRFRDNTNTTDLIDVRLGNGEYPTPNSSWQKGEAFTPAVIANNVTDLEVRIHADMDGTNDAILIDDISVQIVTEVITASNNDVWIANDAIENPQLAADSVKNAQIEANAVNNTSMANNAIDTAELATGAVETVKINDEAVQVPRNSYTASTTNMINSAWTVMQSVSITVPSAMSGEPIQLLFSGRAFIAINPEALQLRLRRDTTTLATFGTVAVDNVTDTILSLLYVNSPSTGTYVYKFEGRTTLFAVGIDDASMIVTNIGK